MAFWNRKKNWEDDYDEYYAQDRRAEPKKDPGRLRFVPHALLLAFVGAMFVVAVGLVSGATMVEKLLISLATPVGVVWLGLIAMVYFCLLMRQGWPAIVGFFCWLVLTIGGNQFVANTLATWREAPFQKIKPLELEPFDTVVLLGGGTSTTISGTAQMGAGGDRVGMAARMYHAGLVTRFVCTGSQPLRATPDDLHPREESAEILLGLGVPRDIVFQMKGENTSQEMANLKIWLAQHAKMDPTNPGEEKVNDRVGVLTSAWHLTRAMRLAKVEGLNVQPIPANFISSHFVPSPNLIVPSGGSLSVTAMMLKEYLARLVGR